jgi:hypothetical protein
MIIPEDILDKLEAIFKANPELRKVSSPIELCLDVYKKVDDENNKELIKLLGDRKEEKEL